jgi:hypothetical protein
MLSVLLQQDSLIHRLNHGEKKPFTSGPVFDSICPQ